MNLFRKLFFLIFFYNSETKKYISFYNCETQEFTEEIKGKTVELIVIDPFYDNMSEKISGDHEIKKIEIKKPSYLEINMELIEKHLLQPYKDRTQDLARLVLYKLNMINMNPRKIHVIIDPCSDSHKPEFNVVIFF